MDWTYCFHMLPSHAELMKQFSLAAQTVVAILFWYTCASCIPVTDKTLAAGTVMVDAETDENRQVF